MITDFRDEYRFLNNFWVLPIPIQYDGVTYLTTEHFFQAMKTVNNDFRMNVAELPTAGAAKKRGRELTLRPDWEQAKVPAMRLGILLKFSANPELKDKLLATGNETLVEGNVWHDNIWGNCTCPKCFATRGLNYLGQLLMDVREMFQLIG